METTHDEVASTMLERDDEKLINRIATTNAPQLEGTESACTGHGCHWLLENKGDDDVIIPRPNSIIPKASATEENIENYKLRYISKHLVQFVPDYKPQKKKLQYEFRS